MFVTARQLEDLYRASGGNGHVTVPYRARLTPLATDFIRARKLVVGYSDVQTPAATPTTDAAPHPKTESDCGCGCKGEGKGSCPPEAATAAAPAATDAVAVAAPASVATGGFLWWCDGPCGPAKAAVTTLEKEASLRSLDQPADARRIVPVIKALAIEVKANRVTGGILLVQNGAAALVYANRCPSLRAVLGTCLEAVEQGVQQVAANVLVIEHPYKTLQQVKNLVGRFTRGRRELSEQARRNLAELMSCG